MNEHIQWVNMTSERNLTQETIAFRCLPDNPSNELLKYRVHGCGINDRKLNELTGQERENKLADPSFYSTKGRSDCYCDIYDRCFEYSDVNDKRVKWVGISICGFIALAWLCWEHTENPL